MPARLKRKKLSFFLLLVCCLLLVLLLYFFFRGGEEDGTTALLHSNVEVRQAAAGADAAVTTIAQSVFISCNRHDRDQTYWDLIALVSVCDGADVATRRASPACGALYAGEATTAAGKTGSCAVADKLPGLRRNHSSGEKAEGEQAAAEAEIEEGNKDRPLDALVWLGDAIYADKRADGRKSLQLFQVSNPLSLVKTFWVAQRRSPIYSTFRDTCVRLKPSGGGATAGTDPDDYFAKAVDPEPRRVYGSWDDHDMGKNDGGKEYPHRAVTQHFFLNFLGADRADPRWYHEGVYTFHAVPFPDGDALTPLLRESYQHAMCFLLLDVRSFRDPPNASQLGDMLGAAQWTWLERRLATDLADGSDGRRACAAVLIGSGTQFMMDVLPAENWGEFPAGRDRLLALLRQYRTERVVFITGDIHMGELAVDFGSAAQQVLGYPLVEATSSGLTHSAGDYGALSKLVPLWFPAPHRRLYIYLKSNFGTIRLTAAADWQETKQGQQALQLAQQLREKPLDKAARLQLNPLLDGLVNLSFGIFAVEEHGRPVIRLTFPLEMLTWRAGPTYAGASVPQPRAGGTVQRRPADSAPPPAVTLRMVAVPDGQGQTQWVMHYPFTEPVPFLTWLARFNQRHFFPGGSVPRSVVGTLKFGLEMSVVVPLSVLLLWGWRRRRARRRQRLAAAQRGRQRADNMFGASGSGTFGDPSTGHGMAKRHAGSIGGNNAVEVPPSASVGVGNAGSNSSSGVGGGVMDDVFDLFVGEGKQKQI
uniref:Alkaline phosphatase n=1 Tax=Strigomonas galati TaxID=1003336 RepID=T1YUV3_9TRYP|nr:alkaline phosphatase [Strigomonas galati]